MEDPMRPNMFSPYGMRPRITLPTLTTTDMRLGDQMMFRGGPESQLVPRSVNAEDEAASVPAAAKNEVEKTESKVEEAKTQ